jgi:hypothetical protein
LLFPVSLFPFLPSRVYSMMSPVRTILLVLIFATTASAQTTWKNLHFGQTRNQVRAQLAAESFPVETSQEGSLQSVSDYDMLLPGMRVALPLRADFRFADDGGLMDVTLSLDFSAMKQNFPDVGGDDQLLAFAAERFTRALTDKYGIPLSKRSDCDADAATLAKSTTAFCSINYHDPGESIELNWLPRTPRLFIRYQMLATDL